MIEYTRREAAAIEHKLRKDDEWDVYEHKAVCHSLLDLLAASHSEELSQRLSNKGVAVAYTGLSLCRPFCPYIEASETRCVHKDWARCLL